MAKLSAYDLDVLLEVSNHDTYLDNHVIDQSVQEMQYFKQPVFINESDIDITSDSNVISYDQYLKEYENEVVQDTSSCAQQDAMIMYVVEELSNQVVKCNEHIICQDVMCTDMHADVETKCVFPANDNRLDYAEMEQSYIDEYSKVLELEAELSKKNDMVKKDINEMKAQLQKKNTTISNLKDHIASLKGTSVSKCTVPVNNSCVIAPRMYKLELEPLSPKLKNNKEALVDYLKKTKEHADTLRDIVEQARAHMQNLGRTFTIDGTKFPLTRITSTIGVPPKKPVPTKVVNNTPPSRTNLRKSKEITSVSLSSKSKVVQVVLWYLDSGCSKHMTGQRSQLINFISKFMGTVRFGNDQVAAIMRHGDYQIGNATISRVYYVEGLGHNLFSMG
ncbi:hypothetical protein Tco_0397290 [Tanacetum coccineum]